MNQPSQEHDYLQCYYCKKQAEYIYPYRCRTKDGWESHVFCSAKCHEDFKKFTQGSEITSAYNKGMQKND